MLREFLFVLLSVQCSAFVLPHGVSRRATPRCRTLLATEAADSNEEIAELEARLAALKQAEAAKAAEAEEAEARAWVDAAKSRDVEPSGPGAESFDASTMSVRKKVANIDGPPPDELLSESWKEAEDAGFDVGPVLKGAAAAAVLFAFSLVPAGNNIDLQPTPTIESPAEIKARYERLGIE